MKNFLHFKQSLLFALSLPLGLCFAQATPAPKSESALSAKHADISVSVKVIASADGVCLHDASSYVWGSEGTCPKNRISGIEVTRAGKALFVPISAFADLGNPSKVTLKKPTNSKYFTVLVSGGDAGTSYQAKLTFGALYLKQRRVESSSFPEDAFEVTNFKFNLENNR